MTTTTHSEHRMQPDADSLPGLFKSAGASALSFGRLLDAELSLAGTALIRLALTGVLAAALLVMLASLIVGGLVALGLAFGLSWAGALGMVAIALFAATLLCAGYAHRLLEQCSLPVSRRELARVFDATQRPSS